MANLHETTDTLFQNNQYGYQFPPETANERQGVGSATITRQMVPTEQRRNTPRLKLTPEKTQTRNIGRTPMRTGKRTLPIPTSFKKSNSESEEQSHNPRKAIQNMANRGPAMARAFSTSVVIFSWTLTVYLIIQLPLAAFSLLMMGAAASVEGNWIYDAALNIWNTVGTILGLPTVDISSLFFLGMAGALVAGYTCLFGALIQYKMAILHPLGGNEGITAKKGTFLAAFVLYAVPGFNLIPWVWLWMIPVTIYPK